MIGVSEMFDADRYGNFDAKFRFSRQGLIKANHPRVTILVFVGVFAWQHVSHRSNDLSRTAEFNFAIVGKIPRNSPLIEAMNFLPWIAKTRQFEIARPFEFVVGSLGTSNFIDIQFIRFYISSETKGKVLSISVFIIYLNLVKWSFDERIGRMWKREIQKSRYSQWGNALKNDTGKRYIYICIRHDGLDRYRVLQKKKKILRECTESNKFRNEITIDRKINYFKTMRFSRRNESLSNEMK